MSHFEFEGLKMDSTQVAVAYNVRLELAYGDYDKANAELLIRQIAKNLGVNVARVQHRDDTVQLYGSKVHIQ